MPTDSEGTQIARCTVQQLMGELGLKGVWHGRQVRTTIADETAPRPLDLVQRDSVLLVATADYRPDSARLSKGPADAGVPQDHLHVVVSCSRGAPCKRKQGIALGLPAPGFVHPQHAIEYGLQQDGETAKEEWTVIDIRSGVNAV